MHLHLLNSFSEVFPTLGKSSTVVPLALLLTRLHGVHALGNRSLAGLGFRDNDHATVHLMTT